MNKKLFICSHLSKCPMNGSCTGYKPFTLEFAKQRGSMLSYGLPWFCYEVKDRVIGVPYSDTTQKQLNLFGEEK